MTQQRRTWTRVVPLAATVAAGALVLAGCSGSATATGPEPQTISFAFGATNDQDKVAYSSLATAYEKAHKGVTVTPQNLPAQSYPTAIATRVQGGNAPDTFQSEGGTGQSYSIIPFAKAGLLLQLTDPAISAALPPSQKELWTYNGKTYGVPLGTNANGVIYSDELAKSIGVNIDASTSLDGIIAQCAAARAKGKTVYGLAGATAANNAFLALGLATSTVYGHDKNWNEKRNAGKTTFAGTQGWVDALTEIKKLNAAGCFQDGAAGAGFDALTNGASQGKILGFFAPSNAAKEIMDAAGGHVKLVILPIAAPDGTKTYLSVSADQSVSASAKTKSPKLTQDFLKYVLSKDGQETYAKAVGTIPVTATASTTLLPQFDTVKDLISSGTVRGFPSTDWTKAKVYNDLGNGVQGILTGQMTVKQVLEQMDADWG
ncbi:carbohydrate ABC transporter substrate-binding protein [Diaminobutyricibacter tongyongensis]|uniref:Carbohydrate ABC transporter substrate-binding protein n=1 Tax=Leifsonia tongyongensis TaxID=1268043 RepID=A0A6L9XWM3_9MICO|nr:ABC transporter substrate-binding protein [Diaminobutyricibacter tongyongensis]NEN05686.1 carbohydrate ABC transporter substrate-binding protein [Diaminobutyricibacter tongyongensis]